MVSRAVQQALDRRLSSQQEAARSEVERILAAALVVMERAYPQSARVVDIVAEAETSNQTFYKYFPGKAELALAVMERGVGRLADYLEHQMGKARSPAGRVERWVVGMLAQVDDATAVRGSLAALAELDRSRLDRPSADDTSAIRRATVTPLRDLLLEPLAAAGAPDPARSADAIYEATIGTVRRHLFAAASPTPSDRRHLVRFCRAGAGIS